MAGIAVEEAVVDIGLAAEAVRACQTHLATVPMEVVDFTAIMEHVFMLAADIQIVRLAKELQYFYKKTGVQPYIVMQSYDASLTTDVEKEAYARAYYDQYIDNEGTFLYMYFGEPNDTTVGYMAYVNGKAVTSVMDEEAVNIFWNYLDRYWTSSPLSMTEVFDKTFTKTADTIMDKSTTGWDIAKYVVIGVVIQETKEERLKNKYL